MDNHLTQYIIKQSERKDKNLKYDFLPSLLEIIERPSHIAGKIIISSLALLIITAFFWSYFSQLDIIVIGVGNIIPEGKISEVQSYVGGKVEKIYFNVGDYINEGDPIISIDSDLINIEVEKLKEKLEWCEIRYDIYTKLLNDDEPIINSDDYNSKYYNAISTIIIDFEIYLMQKEQQLKSKESLENDLAEAEANGDETMINLHKERVENSENTIKTSLIQRQSQMHSILSGIENEINEYETQLKTYQINLEYLIIKSPVNGYLNSITVNYAGQMVSAAQSIATIVPNKVPLSFECYVQDRDIGNISINDEVVVKLSAFSYSDYGAVSGKVNYISPSAFANEKLGNVYIVRISVNTDNINKEIELISGLSATAEIIVGKRSVLDYFLEPIIEGFDSSLKES